MEDPKVPEWFINEMNKKLQDNKQKGHWGNCSSGYLAYRLIEECGELLNALFNNEGDEIDGEAGDVANIAMMIADNYGSLYHKRG